MRSRSRSSITVDLLTSVVDVAEVAKFAAKYGFDLRMDHVVDEQLGRMEYQRMALERADEAWLQTEIADLLLLLAITGGGRSLNDLLAAVRADLEERHAPMDRPIQDVMGLGEAPSHPESNDA